MCQRDMLNVQLYISVNLKCKNNPKKQTKKHDIQWPQNNPMCEEGLLCIFYFTIRLSKKAEHGTQINNNLLRLSRELMHY